MQFDAIGAYVGYDAASPLTQLVDGKLQASFENLKLEGPIIAAGDGATDLAMRDAVDRFVALHRICNETNNRGRSGRLRCCVVRRPRCELSCRNRTLPTSTTYEDAKMESPMTETLPVHRLDGISLGKIVQIRETLLRAQAKGARVIRFESGDPSFSVTPACSRRHRRQAGAAGKTHYIPNDGIPELRRALA